MSKDKLLSVFEELREALLDCNVNKLEKLISDDYQGFTLHGTIEHKELILQSFQPGGVHLSTYDVEDISCEVSDTLGIITGKGKIEGSYGEHVFQHDVLFTDIFKFENSNWKYYKSQITEISTA